VKRNLELFAQIAGFQSRDYDDVLNSHGGREWSGQWKRWRKVHTVLLYTLLQEKDINKKSNICWTWSLRYEEERFFNWIIEYFPAIEAVDISNYLVLQTYFDFTKFGNVTRYTNSHLNCINSPLMKWSLMLHMGIFPFGTSRPQMTVGLASHFSRVFQSISCISPPLMNNNIWYTIKTPRDLIDWSNHKQRETVLHLYLAPRSSVTSYENKLFHKRLYILFMQFLLSTMHIA